MIIRCPKCSKEIEVPDDVIGRNVRCCYCNEKFEVDENQLRNAVQEGDAQAQYELGNCYYDGIGVPRDINAAVGWMKMAAERDYAEAQFRLAEILETWGNDVGRSEIPYWYGKAAKQGLIKAAYALGHCYDFGVGSVIKPDKALAEKWYRIAAEKGNPEAQCAMCRFSKDENESVQWIRKAADQKNSSGQLLLGTCYRHGRGVAKDVGVAIKWFRKAAEQGNAQALNELGECYRNGEGVEKNDFEAAKFFSQSANGGFCDGQYNFAKCYKEGCGVEQSFAEAIKWFRMATVQYHTDSMYELGMCYYKGNGVVKDVSEAVKLFLKAAEHGHAKAQYQLGEYYCEENF